MKRVLVIVGILILAAAIAAGILISNRGDNRTDDDAAAPVDQTEPVSVPNDVSGNSEALPSEGAQVADQGDNAIVTSAYLPNDIDSDVTNGCSDTNGTSSNSAGDVINNSDNNGTQNQEYVTPVDEEPVPPVPELSTTLLITVGVLGVAGYLALRKRKHRILTIE